MEHWRFATEEEAEEIKKSAYDQYKMTVLATLKTIGVITVLLLCAGALVQLLVLLIAGHNVHFYGFVAYYIAIALGMAMVAWTNFEQERRLYQFYAGIRYLVSDGTALAVREEKAAFHYSVRTGVRYTKKYYVDIVLEDGTETEADVPLPVWSGIKPGTKLLCLHSDNANEEKEVNLVHIRS